MSLQVIAHVQAMKNGAVDISAFNVFLVILVPSGGHEGVVLH